jgi:UDP:flavonoid glycosyltransferase YjiC (YdhE family)
MHNAAKSIKIAVSSLTQDAGEATRALELAKGLREACPESICIKIIFLSHGSAFDRVFFENGFEVYQVRPKLAGVGFMSDLSTTTLNMIGSVELAYDLLKGEIDALREICPEVLIHGFWPIAGIASKICKIQKEICYLPIPFEKGAFSNYLLQDLPDFLVPLTYLPISFRKMLMRGIPKALKLKTPILKQSNIIKALRKLDYNGKKLEIHNLFDMLGADFTIINDFPDFYRGYRLPDNFKVTGPLFSIVSQSQSIDSEIIEHFSDSSGKIRIFCTLGSSGRSEHLVEAIKALISLPSEKYESVVLCPKAVCPIERAKAEAAGFSNIYITDSFIPALQVNSMADIVLSHGGQGTVQTAVASGTPIVGFAMQPEQQANLDHIAAFGGAIRLPINKWKSKNIKKAIIEISSSVQYKENIQILQKVLQKADGKKNAAAAILDFIFADH